MCPQQQGRTRVPANNKRQTTGHMHSAAAAAKSRRQAECKPSRYFQEHNPCTLVQCGPPSMIIMYIQQLLASQPPMQANPCLQMMLPPCMQQHWAKASVQCRVLLSHPTTRRGISQQGCKAGAADPPKAGQVAVLSIQFDLQHNSQAAHKPSNSLPGQNKAKAATESSRAPPEAWNTHERSVVPHPA